jgi:hypothetical protein
VELLVAEPGTISVPGAKAKPTQSSTNEAAPAPKKKAGAAKTAKPATPATREVAPVARTFAPADDDKALFLIALVALLVAVGAALAASVSKLGASSRVTGVGVGLMLSAMCIGIGFAAAALLS